MELTTFQICFYSVLEHGNWSCSKCIGFVVCLNDNLGTAQVSSMRVARLNFNYRIVHLSLVVVALLNITVRIAQMSLMLIVRCQSSFRNCSNLMCCWCLNVKF